MRSGARGFIHPFKDEPAVALPVRFYRVPRDRPILDIPTAFVFDQWDKEGELESFPGFEYAYQWDRGIDDRGVSGARYCGTPDQWLNGPNKTDPLPPINPNTGLPVCCGPAIIESFGGQAEGGIVQAIPVVFSSAGGQAEGGISFEAVVAGDVGGQAEGGISFEAVTAPGFGGQAEGGISFEAVAAIDAGGQAEGGEGAGIGVILLGTGGQAEGETEPPFTAKVKVAGCPQYLSTRLRATFTTKQGTCSCLPNTCDFQWDGAKWQSVTSHTGCSGTDLINWYIKPNAAPPYFQLWDTIALRNISGGCGPPLNGTLTVTMPSYCSGTLLRGWIAAITEV